MSQTDNTTDEEPEREHNKSAGSLREVAERAEQKVSHQADALTPFVAGSKLQANAATADQFDTALHAFVIAYLQSHDGVTEAEIAAVLWNELRWFRQQVDEAQAASDEEGPAPTNKSGRTTGERETDGSESSLSHHPEFQ